ILAVLVVVGAGFRRLGLASLGLVAGRLGLLGSVAVALLGLVRWVFLFGAGIVRRLALIVVLVLVALAELVGHFERGEQRADGRGEALLVDEVVGELAEVVAGFFLDPVAPEIDDLLGRLRRLLPGQLLTHHQCDSVLERGF